MSEYQLTIVVNGTMFAIQSTDMTQLRKFYTDYHADNVLVTLIRKEETGAFTEIEGRENIQTELGIN